MLFSKNFLLRIRPTILILLIILIGSVIATTLLLQYYFSEKLAVEATQDKFRHVSERIEQQIENMDKQNADLISILELNQDIKKELSIDEAHPLLPVFTQAILNNPFIYALYLGYENGDFYEVINVDIAPSLQKRYKIKQSVHWMVLKILVVDGKRMRYEIFLDENFKEVERRSRLAKYDPRVRPWYKKAGKVREMIKIPPYMYTNLQSPGVSYSKKIPNTTATLAVDVTLDGISQFLKKHTGELDKEIFIFNNAGTILGSNILSPRKVFEKTYDKAVYPYEKVMDFIMLEKQNDVHEMIKLKNDEEYFLYSKRLELSHDESEHLAILLPKEHIMAPYREKIFYSFLITLSILTFTVPLIWYFTRILSQPILQLARESKKIKERKFDEVVTVPTRIREISELSHSLVNMSKSIQAFQASQKELMNSFIKLIASAIDAKSNYTGEHCERVPILTMMMAREASNATHSIFKEFSFKSEEEYQELSIAAWLHDCGKVTTPEYIVDKATKLETIYNRIHEIRTRFEVVYRDEIIQAQEKFLSDEQKAKVQQKGERVLDELTKEFETVANANIGTEFMERETIEYLHIIAKRKWKKHFDSTLGLSMAELQRVPSSSSEWEHLLEDKVEHIIPRQKKLIEQFKQFGFKTQIPKDLYNLGELYNLSIKRGTLTNEDRFKINEHIMMSIIMLEQLPFPEHLKKVPEYAGAHHETLIGTGYPRQLTKDKMSIPSRIMVIADIFEALTATGRPYKEAKTLSESIRILSFMAKDNEIDADIFKLFLTTGIYEKYAKEHLKPEQIDEVDISKYL